MLNHSFIKGYSLIEVLVSTLILAVGILGLTGLQNVGLQHSNSSHYRSQAVVIANDIFERMRVNKSIAQAGNYDFDGALPSVEPTNSCSSSATGVCSAAEMAQRDVYDWAFNISAQLPSGQGLIDRDDSDDTVFTVTVRWLDEQVISAEPEAGQESLAITCGEAGFVCIQLVSEL